VASTTSRPLNVTGFSSDAWLGPRGVWLSSDSNVVGLTSVRLKHIFPLLCTPPWALHTGWTGSLQAQQELRAKLVETTSMLGVVDLGPQADPALEAPHGWQSVVRHTRQCALSEDPADVLPKTRVKQARRFEREGGRTEVLSGAEPWDEVAALHVASRSRKGLPHSGEALSNLLTRLAPCPWTFAVLAKNERDEVVASGGFVVLPSGVCVYSFGGQRRSGSSGRASVAMLMTGMRQAYAMGCHTFDFGGSQDDGVDRFYAEFGATPVKMTRWVHAPRWFRWAFPKLWTSWTSPSRHVD